MASEDDWNSTCRTERTAHAVGIVAFVAEQVLHSTAAFEKGGRGFDVADVARCQHQCIGTDDIGERMGLHGPTAPGTPDRLREARLFAPNAAREILKHVLSIAML